MQIFSKFSTPVAALSNLQSLLLHSILGNYSITNSRLPGTLGLCADGRFREEHLYPMRYSDPISILDCVLLPTKHAHGNAYPLVIKQDLERLRFLDCGSYQNIGTLHYQELLNVFQPNVWLSVLTTIFLVSASLHYFFDGSAMKENCRKPESPTR